MPLATPLTAKANTGAGTDLLAIVTTASGSAGVVALVDDSGALVTAASPLNVTTTKLPAAFGAGGGLKIDGSGTALPVSGTVTASSADTTSSGTITAISQSVVLALNGQSGVAIQITNTWVGTLQFEGTLDGTNWVAINGVYAGSSTPNPTITANGIVRLTPSGLAQVRITSTAWTSGTATIAMRASAATGGTFINQSLTAGTNTIGGVLTTTATASATTVLQNAVAITGNGSNLTVTGYGTALLQVTGTFVATVNFEASNDAGVTWDAISSTKIGASTIASSTTTIGQYRITCTGFDLIRARVTWTSGTSITINGRATNAVNSSKIMQLANGTNAIGSITNTTFTATQATGTNLHTVTDTGSTTVVTGNVTVVQPTGTNLHAVLDTGSTTAVTQATGTNLHVVSDTGSTTAVTGNVTVVQATPASLQMSATQVVGTAATRWFAQISDGTTSPAIKAASTAAATTDPAFVVSLAGANSATKIGDGTNNAAIKAASTAAAFTDPALTADVRPGGALVTASAALADALANPTLGKVAMLSHVYNGTTWDRQRGMGDNLTTGDTGAKVATGNGATITNVGNKGIQIVLSMGAVTGTTPTFVLKVQGSVDAGTNWYDVPGATTASLVATGIWGIMLYPGAAVTAGTTTTGTTAGASGVIPRTWRVVWTVGGTTPSFTITSITYNYIPN